MPDWGVSSSMGVHDVDVPGVGVLHQKEVNLKCISHNLGRDLFELGVRKRKSSKISEGLRRPGW
jgi:hypothetical protein